MVVAPDTQANVKMQLWDTAGQERFRSITRSYYRGAHAALVVNDVTSRVPFDNVARWAEEARQHWVCKQPSFMEGIMSYDIELRLVLVATKIDLDEQREVSPAEGRAMADALGCPFVEAMATDPATVTAAFERCLLRLTSDAVRDGVGRQGGVRLPAARGAPIRFANDDPGAPKADRGPCGC